MNDMFDLSGTPEQRLTRHAAIAAGGMAAIAGVGLLALSGWFLTGAALAGIGGIAAVQAFNYLLPSAAIRGFAIVRTLGRYGERLLGHRAALHLLADLRPRLFARLAAAPLPTLHGLAGGEIAGRLGGDVEALENLVIRQVSIGASLAGALAGLVATALAGLVPMAMLALGLLASTVVAAWFAPRWLAAAHAAHGEALLARRSAYAEYAGCGIEIAIYDLVPRIAAELDRVDVVLDAARQAIVRREAALQQLHGMLAVVTVGTVIATTSASVPIVALAALAAAATFEAWSGVTHALVQNPRADAARQRLTTIASLPERKHATATLRGDCLQFTVASASVMLPVGGRIRIAGPSGSGKSRLLGTLARLREDAPERIAIDGMDVTSLPFDAVRPLFALSAQDAPLIAGTVADNLRLARAGVTEPEMWEALQVACLDEVVRSMPEGLTTWLGVDGARLSGGQRKRLSLARALVARRPWLLLDEPSEGLDLATERRLAENLGAWLQETGTGLVMANHRPGLDRLCELELRLG